MCVCVVFGWVGGVCVCVGGFEGSGRMDNADLLRKHADSGLVADCHCDSCPRLLRYKRRHADPLPACPQDVAVSRLQVLVAHLDLTFNRTAQPWSRRTITSAR